MLSKTLYAPLPAPALTEADKTRLTEGADDAKTAADELADKLDLNETPNLTTSSAIEVNLKTAAVTDAKDALGDTEDDNAGADDALDDAADVLLTWAQQEHSGF